MINSYPNPTKSETSAVIDRLSACVSSVTDISSWCASRKLQLNTAKTEIVWFGSRANLNKISGSDLCLHVGSDVIKPREVVRDLGVYLDSELSLKQHVSKSPCPWLTMRQARIRRQRYLNRLVI